LTLFPDELPDALSIAGVTEMRMGQFTTAARRFQRALDLDPTLKIVEDNLSELGKFINVEEELSGMRGMRGGQKHKHKVDKPMSIPVGR
jgi:hypothetical protein